MTKMPVSRRSFIKITALAGGGMVVAFNIDELLAQGRGGGPGGFGGGAMQANAFITFTADAARVVAHRRAVGMELDE
jgi:hypothetical protein